MPNDTSLPADVTTLPLLPLRDVVVFPHMVIPLFVGRPKSIKALDVAMDAGKHILLVAQKQAAKDDPTAADLYDIGSVATVLQMLKLPDGTVKVLVEGTQRARIRTIEERAEYLAAHAQPIPGEPGTAHEVEAMRRALLAQFDQYVKLNKKIPPEILTSMSGIDDGGRLADAIAAGCGGVVCSTFEVERVHAARRDFVTIVPGVRFADGKVHDQARVSTPDAAARAGADVLVIGRAVTDSAFRQALIDDARTACKDYDLTEDELDALEKLDASSLMAFAGTLDSRISKTGGAGFM